ncbi:hypothetical protein [Methanogenium organophilum]|uniref:Uncharacterized protein n=1 Tax=Methanogenium organophilum TaxID=2199 RepID=A0A9X9T7U2_METOG|nr:hypothetical protein [Methanogenium organophilum]WAI01449.1 hypothetical protein OU421_00835 [Methanogenium organophilum]
MGNRNKFFLILVAFVMVFICIFYYPVLLCPILPQTTTINLVEIRSSSIDFENRTITSISEDDFKKYPELGELFHNITPIGDGNFGERDTKIVNSLSVSERKASEMRKEHSSKTFYWKGGYYGILIQQP